MPLEKLEDRGFLAVVGKDRKEFLQGLITQDIKKLETEPLIYSCLLTPQGKYLADFFVFDFEESLVLDIERSRVEAVMKVLNVFKLRADIVIIDKSSDYFVTAIWDEKDMAGYPDPRKKEMGYRLYHQTLVHYEAKKGCYNTHRYQLGIPEGTKDIVLKRSTIQEAGLDQLNAVDWKKGCYMGQELTARIHYRGLIKKRLFPFHFEGEIPLTETHLSNIDGETIGKIRSVHSVSQNSGYGLALIKLEHYKKEAVISLKSCTITLT